MKSYSIHEGKWKNISIFFVSQLELQKAQKPRNFPFDTLLPRILALDFIFHLQTISQVGVLFLQMAQHAASPEGQRTVSRICTVLLFTQMDMIYDLSPRYKKQYISGEFLYNLAFHLPRGVGCKHFYLQRNVSM